MIRPDMSKWEQTLADLRLLSLNADHQRTRERFQALYMIAMSKPMPRSWAEEIGRNDETVLKWVHTYNEQGPTALLYQRTGGRPPFLAKNRQSR